MQELLPPFVLNELQLYISDFETEFFESLASIIGSEKEPSRVRNLLVKHLKDLKVSKFGEIDQYLLLTTMLLCYWSKEYETNLSLYNKFQGQINQ